MRATFLLPGSARFPVGGYKVVYEYANHLSDRGHQVTVVHPALLDERDPWFLKLYHQARYISWGATNLFGPQKWFNVRPGVQLKWVPTLGEANIPDADVVIATGWPTAEYTAGYSSSKGRRYYLLQHYETWWGPEARVRTTWQLPLHKIVIARWLEKIANDLGETATYIPNGLDFEAFGCDVPVYSRGRHVAMLFHKYEWKGSADGIKALEIARQDVHDLTATLFGVSRRPASLSSWISYLDNPPQSRLRQLYNDAAVFVSPSWTEGWPLPPAEAMMSGAALVCTDIGGHREYAVDGRNALMAPAQAPEALAAALVRAVTDNALRESLATTARADISRFTWNAAVDKFEATLLNADLPVSCAAIR